MTLLSRGTTKGLALGFLTLLGILLVGNRIGVIAGQHFQGFINERYLNYQLGVVTHSLLGLFYVLPIVLQFSKRFRARHLRLHRWLGRVSLLAGLGLGLNAIYLQTQLQKGALAVHGYLFAVLFLYSIGAAYTAIRRGDVTSHKVWTIRAFGNAIGVSVGVRIVTILCFVMFRISDKIPMARLLDSDRRLITAIMFLSSWLGTLVPVLIAEIIVAKLLARRTMRLESAQPS